MAYLVDIGIPAFPQAPEEALEALRVAVEAVLERSGLGPEGWQVTPKALRDELAAFGGRGAEGLSFSVSIRGAWEDESPPEQWSLEANVRATPQMTRADQLIGVVVVAMCLAGGATAGGGAFWMLSTNLFIAGSVAITTALFATVACLGVAVFVTPRSAAPEVPQDVRERFEGAVAHGVVALVADGRFEACG